jgi:hypothetical protein
VHLRESVDPKAYLICLGDLTRINPAPGVEKMRIYDHQTLDHRHSLLITWLNSLWSTSLLCSCYDELSRDLVYHKASFVEVIYIIITDVVLGLYLLYKLKHLRISTEWILI